jgi:hypothetical protein
MVKWINLAQDRGKYRNDLKAFMSFWFYKLREYFDYLRKHWFLKK